MAALKSLFKRARGDDTLWKKLFDSNRDMSLKLDELQDSVTSSKDTICEACECIDNLKKIMKKKWDDQNVFIEEALDKLKEIGLNLSSIDFLVEELRHQEKISSDIASKLDELVNLQQDISEEIRSQTKYKDEIITNIESKHEKTEALINNKFLEVDNKINLSNNEIVRQSNFLFNNYADDELYRLTDRQNHIRTLCKGQSKEEESTSLQSDPYNTEELFFLLFHYQGHLARFNTVNLGDYVQTIALERAIKSLFPKSIFEYWDRDSLNFYRTSLNHNGKKPKYLEPPPLCFMQGWLAHSLNFLPNSKMTPIWYASHFQDNLKPFIVNLLSCVPDYFTHPVGCRDEGTLSFMRELKQDSYLSRCSTLLFDRESTVFDKTGNLYEKVYFVNIPEHILPLFPNEMKNNARYVNQRGIECRWEYWEKTYRKTEKLLDEYLSNASLVVTTALHCAAPCIAMGIPVVLIALYPEENLPRFSALKGLLKIYTLQDLKTGGIDFRSISPLEFEDLKNAMKYNMHLSINEAKGAPVTSELLEVREFIERYSLTN